MTDGIQFLLIDQPQQLDRYFSSLVRLLELSIDDDAILGINQTLSDEAVEYYRSDLKKQIEAGTLKLMIAVNENEEVILNCLFKGSIQNTTKHIFDLQKGFIHPQYRHTGLLPKAMLFIAKTAKAQGVDVLTLDVRDGTPAHKLWKRVGFKTFGIMDDYSRYEGKSYHGHYMSMTTDALFEQFKKTA